MYHIIVIILISAVATHGHVFKFKKIPKTYITINVIAMS